MACDRRLGNIEKRRVSSFYAAGMTPDETTDRFYEDERRRSEDAKRKQDQESLEAEERRKIEHAEAELRRKQERKDDEDRRRESR